jgi:hypothetical protein
MEKEFVPYELALRMKALGFDGPCMAYYIDWISPTQGLIHIFRRGEVTGTSPDLISAPTWQSAFRWFREKYDLPSWTYESEGKWFWKIVKGDFWEQDQKPYTFEEAELACLTKLIEIVEK